MEYYPVLGEWDQQKGSQRWLAWSTDSSAEGETDLITGWFRRQGRRLSMFTANADGTPGERFATGTINRIALFKATEDGIWGSNPGPSPLVDVWGDGINKLASLHVTNQSIYDALFQPDL